jgi:hypothetical protein
MSWKRAERVIARILGGERIPVNGRRGPDATPPALSVQVKHRETIPGYMLPSREMVFSMGSLYLLQLADFFPLMNAAREALIARARAGDMHALNSLSGWRQYLEHDWHTLPGHAHFERVEINRKAPGYLTEWFSTVSRGAYRWPIVVMHRPRTRYEQSIVAIHQGDFVEIFALALEGLDA